MVDVLFTYICYICIVCSKLQQQILCSLLQLYTERGHQSAVVAAHRAVKCESLDPAFIPSPNAMGMLGMFQSVPQVHRLIAVISGSLFGLIDTEAIQDFTIYLYVINTKVNVICHM